MIACGVGLGHKMTTLWRLGGKTKYACPARAARWTGHDQFGLLPQAPVLADARCLARSRPPTAIRYMVTKYSLVPRGPGRLYVATAKAARELDLPVQFKGGLHHGRRIPFAC